MVRLFEFMHSSKLLLRFCGIGGAPFFAGVSVKREIILKEMTLDRSDVSIYIYTYICIVIEP